MEERVIEIIAEKLSLNAEDITMGSNIVADLGADSLDIVELVMDLEDEVGVEIPTEIIEGFKTVKDVVEYLESVK